jgi:ribosomal protein S30
LDRINAKAHHHQVWRRRARLQYRFRVISGSDDPAVVRVEQPLNAAAGLLDVFDHKDQRGHLIIGPHSDGWRIV